MTVTLELGGVRTAEVAELHLLDMETREIEWREALLPGVTRYTDMMLRPDGMVFGIADGRRFFVFDTVERAIVHEDDFSERLGTAAMCGAGPRPLVEVPDGRIFILLYDKGIAHLKPDTYEITFVTTTPAPITPAAYLKGRIYRGSGTNVYSWEVPPAE